MKKQSYQSPVIRLYVLQEECLLNPASSPSASYMTNPGFSEDDDDDEGYEE